MKVLWGLGLVAATILVAAPIITVQVESVACAKQANQTLIDVVPWDELLQAPPVAEETNAFSERIKNKDFIYKHVPKLSKLPFMRSHITDMKKCQGLGENQADQISDLTSEHPLSETSDSLTQLIHLQSFRAKEAMSPEMDTVVRNFALSSNSRNLWNVIFETEAAASLDWLEVADVHRAYADARGEYGRDVYVRGLAESAHASCEVQQKRFIANIRPWVDVTQPPPISGLSNNFTKTIVAFPEVFDQQIYVDAEPAIAILPGRISDLSLCAELAEMEAQKWRPTSDVPYILAEGEASPISMLYSAEANRRMAENGNVDALRSLSKQASLTKTREASNVAIEALRMDQGGGLAAIRTDYAKATGSYASRKTKALCLRNGSICTFDERLALATKGIQTNDIKSQFRDLNAKYPAPTIYRNSWGQTIRVEPTNDICIMKSNFYRGNCSVRETYDVGGGRLNVSSSAAFMGIGKVTTRYYLSDLNNSYTEYGGECRYAWETVEKGSMPFDGRYETALMWRVVGCNDEKIGQTLLSLTRDQPSDANAVKRIDQALKTYDSPAIMGHNRIRALAMRAALTGTLDKAKALIQKSKDAMVETVLDAYVDAEVNGAMSQYDAIVKRQGNFAKIWDGSSANGSGSGSCTVTSINFDAGGTLGDSVAGLKLSGPTGVNVQTNSGGATLSSNQCVTGQFSYIYTVKTGLYHKGRRTYRGQFTLPKNNGSCTVFPENGSVQCY